MGSSSRPIALVFCLALLVANLGAVQGRSLFKQGDAKTNGKSDQAHGKSGEAHGKSGEAHGKKDGVFGTKPAPGLCLTSRDCSHAANTFCAQGVCKCKNACKIYTYTGTKKNSCTLNLCSAAAGQVCQHVTKYTATCVDAPAPAPAPDAEVPAPTPEADAPAPAPEPIP